MSPARVDVLPLTAGTAEHLGLYAAMDVSLDPFPYAGTTTTCESLFMGVPVVTLAGALLSPARPSSSQFNWCKRVSLHACFIQPFCF